MNAPLPPEAPPSPSRSTRSGPQGFVTVLAWITIVLGILGVAYGLLQLLVAALVPADAYLQMLDPLGTGQVDVPPLLRWVLTHNGLIGTIEAIASLLLTGLGFGVLRRREWARLGFIWYLVLATVMTFGGIWLVPATLDASLASQAALLSPDGSVPPELAPIRTLALVFSVIVAVVFSVLHGAIIWKLSTGPVRAQFQRNA